MIQKKLATLAFLKKENKLLLGKKKRGFAQGKWNGFGGKQQADEKIENTMKRELKEECGVEAKEFEHVAILEFQNQKDDFWTVWVYLVTDWSGEPEESDEMIPAWYDVDDLPFGQMWPDDRQWLPRVLSGERIKGSFVIENDDLKQFDIMAL